MHRTALCNNGAQQLASEATVYIQLEDVNDEIPLFTEREQETVLEGEPIGTKVTQVNAIDKDGTFPNNQVYYYIVDSPRNEGKDFFEINLQSGEIFTKVVFDREKQGAYALEVEARDGAPSARPNSNQQPNSDSPKSCELIEEKGMEIQKGQSRLLEQISSEDFPPFPQQNLWQSDHSRMSGFLEAWGLGKGMKLQTTHPRMKPEMDSGKVSSGWGLVCK
uniref:Cadherin domain-containing protein n=1 Tax=Anopheles culicifacies TaxID=139723 RepID=A0A182MDZ3_9DIPT